MFRHTAYQHYYHVQHLHCQGLSQPLVATALASGVAALLHGMMWHCITDAAASIVPVFSAFLPWSLPTLQQLERRVLPIILISAIHCRRICMPVQAQCPSWTKVPLAARPATNVPHARAIATTTVTAPVVLSAFREQLRRRPCQVVLRQAT